MPYLTDLTVYGVTVAVTVTPNGEFHGYVGRVQISSLTLTGLRAALQAEARRQGTQVIVPFTYMDMADGIRHGVATSVHPDRAAVVVSWQDGGAGQIAEWNAGLTFRPLTGDEVTELTALSAADREARKALADFTAPRRVHLLNKVREATEHALAGGADGRQSHQGTA